MPSVQGESQGFDRVGQWGRLRAGGLEVHRGERGFQLGECWGHSQRWEGVPGGRWMELPESAELRLSLLRSSLGGILKAGFPNAAKQSSPSTALGLADIHLGMTCGGGRQGAWSSGREAPTRVCTRAYPPGSWASTSSLLAPACVWESKPPALPSAGAVHSTAQKFLAGLELVSAACVLWDPRGGGSQEGDPRRGRGWGCPGEPLAVLLELLG